jgi:alpha-L-fucosidase
MSKPTEKQLSFLEWELGLFLHFGIRTFHEGHTDWDGRAMSPEAFLPSALDCRQWIETASEAGFRYAVLTAKHHDGFANWPTKYSGYSVAASPWKDGQGDVVREFVDACAAFGVKSGLYYSPADDSLNKSDWTASSYDDYFVNQVTELLTGYGEIDVLWFDGSGSEGHTYDWPRIIGEIRRLQPGIRIFNMGDPDFRWIGNEAGLAPEFNWNEVDAVPFSIHTEAKERVGADGHVWLPAECDCRMREENWFYSERDEHTVKSLDELMGLYDYSVGRGANLLINIGPDRRGLLPDKDAARLREFGAEIRSRFGRPLFRAEDFVREGDRYAVRAERPFLLNHAALMEPLRDGQRIKRFRILIKPYPYGDPICVYEGSTVGHKRIASFPTVRTREAFVEAFGDDGPAELEDIRLFHATGATP